MSAIVNILWDILTVGKGDININETLKLILRYINGSLSYFMSWWPSPTWDTIRASICSKKWLITTRQPFVSVAAHRTKIIETLFVCVVFIDLIVFRNVNVSFKKASTIFQRDALNGGVDRKKGGRPLAERLNACVNECLKWFSRPYLSFLLPLVL